MAMKKGLGKGLDTLIPMSEGKVKNSKGENASPDKFVNIGKVEPNPDQPRKNFNEDKLDELTDSIKQHGIISPLVVVDKGDFYMIVAGERRWRAALKAGLKEVPVIIRNDLTDEDIVIISLLENIQRDDLNPIEEAQTYKKLIDTYNLRQDEVAEKVSKSRVAVTNALRLLKLSDDVQQMLIEDMISAGHAKALVAVDNKEKQYELAQRILDEKLSVREIEKIIRDMGKPKKEKAKAEKELSFLFKDLEEKMKNKLGTKVIISAKDNDKGKIEIEYFSKEELDRITEMLLNAE